MCESVLAISGLSSFTIDSAAAEALGFRPSSTLDALLRYARSPD